jgi:hypothetical protein
MPLDHLYSDFDFTDDFEIRQEIEKELVRKINETPADIREALKPFIPSADLQNSRITCHFTTRYSRVRQTPRRKRL